MLRETKHRVSKCACQLFFALFIVAFLQIDLLHDLLSGACLSFLEIQCQIFVTLVADDRLGFTVNHR